jgi:demethylmenaquinone methyltransferase / 2-methoxy-6-polyprenyl-1,4-benzoquinol methylase
MEQKGSPILASGQPQDAARAVRSMFARVAPRYDFLNHLLSARFDIWWRSVAARELRPILERPHSIAADLCCGTGDLTFAFARHSRGLVVGADFCHPMLQVAGRKRSRLVAAAGVSADGAGSDGAARTRFIEADTLGLPFRDNSLDLASAAFGFRNLANYDEGLREIHRVLRPGGVIAILEFSRIEWPVLGPLFRLYFQHILPLIGTVISGERGPYQYLPNSVRNFPDQEALAQSLGAHGFSEVRYRNFLGGIAALHTGFKADSGAGSPGPALRHGDA